jgi:hypothetical protein
MNYSTKLKKLEHMKQVCLAMQERHGNLVVYRPDAVILEKASIAQTQLFKKQEKSGRTQEAKALEAKILRHKKAITLFVDRHKLAHASIGSILTSKEKKHLNRKRYESTAEQQLEFK